MVTKRAIFAYDPQPTSTMQQTLLFRDHTRDTNLLWRSSTSSACEASRAIALQEIGGRSGEMPTHSLYSLGYAAQCAANLSLHRQLRRRMQRSLPARAGNGARVRRSLLCRWFPRATLRRLTFEPSKL